MVHARQATADDIAELVRLRELLFTDLSAGWGPLPAGTDWRDACAAFLHDQLSDDSNRIVVIDGAPGLAACGMGSIDRRLPSPHNPSGLIGYILGIVTDRRYRRRGHARLIMENLLQWFDDRDLRRVDLHASPDGQELYRSLGFDDHPDPTLIRKR
jgi:ribosomal protein S18 acetylase RimI-like enzyme